MMKNLIKTLFKLLNKNKINKNSKFIVFIKNFYQKIKNLSYKIDVA